MVKALTSNSSASAASTAAPDGWRMEQTIPDYFSGSVLLRTSPTYPHTFTGELRFQTLFNIVVIWMAVFIGLSKGLKSYGKVVYLTSSLSLLGFLVFATKIIDVLPLTTFKVWLVNTSWIDYSGESWVSAARETFFTWGILGATMLQLASHNRCGGGHRKLNTSPPFNFYDGFTEPSDDEFLREIFRSFKAP